MLLWLMPVAFAGTAVEEMDAIALARQPALAVACSPSAAVYQSLQGLFQLPFVSSRLGAVAGPELVLLTSPEQLRALGVADDGVWSAVMAPQELSLTLPFHGSADQAKALLRPVCTSTAAN